MRKPSSVGSFCKILLVFNHENLLLYGGPSVLLRSRPKPTPRTQLLRSGLSTRAFISQSPANIWRIQTMKTQSELTPELGPKTHNSRCIECSPVRSLLEGIDHTYGNHRVYSDR